MTRTTPVVAPPRVRRYTDRALCEKFRQCDGNERRLIDCLVDRMWGLGDEDTRIDCSEAGFSEFLIANPQLGGHADLIWQLHAVYWRNKRLGHPKAVGLLIQYARAWAARNPGETAIGRLQARKTPMTQGRRP